MEHKLSTYVELISDDFQSTFTVISDNVLMNMCGPGDFEIITKIIQNYIPEAKLSFIKSNYFKDNYDIYYIKMV